jgi:hypothetical protein
MASNPPAKRVKAVPKLAGSISGTGGGTGPRANALLAMPLSTSSNPHDSSMTPVIRRRYLLTICTPFHQQLQQILLLNQRVKLPQQLNCPAIAPQLQ